MTGPSGHHRHPPADRAVKGLTGCLAWASGPEARYEAGATRSSRGRVGEPGFRLTRGHPRAAICLGQRSMLAHVATAVRCTGTFGRRNASWSATALFASATGSGNHGSYNRAERSRFRQDGLIPSAWSARARTSSPNSAPPGRSRRCFEQSSLLRTATEKPSFSDLLALTDRYPDDFYAPVIPPALQRRIGRSFARARTRS